MQVRDVMTSDPVACVPGDRVTTAAKIMVDLDCGAVPVVDSQQRRQVIGILTDRDIVCRVVARGENPAVTGVGECMTPNVWTVRPSESVEALVRLMEEKRIRRVPVVEDGRILVGIVATADLARKLHDERLVGEVLEKVSEPQLVGVP